MRALIKRDLALEDPSDQKMTNTNLEFHEALWQASHNLILIDLLGRLRSHLIHAPKSTLSEANRWRDSLGEHASLVDAIEDGDARLAGDIAEQHMTTARAIRLELLQREAIHQVASEGDA